MVGTLNFHLESWMSDLEPIIRNRKLTELFIPGSHDSPMDMECLTQPSWPFNGPTDLGPDASDPVKKYPTYLWPVRSIIRNWGVTQKLSLCDQLQAGVRYFDLRIANINGVFKFTHALQSHKDIATILAPVKEWMSSHPKEVLILHCQHFFDVKPEYDRLLGVFQCLFGDMLSTRNNINEVEFQQYVNSGKRILLIWHGDGAASLSNPSLVYDQGEALNNTFEPAHMQTKEDLVEFLQKDQGERPVFDPKLSVIQGILDTEQLFWPTFVTSSLLSYEKDLNEYLETHLLSGLGTSNGFIYMLDNVAHPNSQAFVEIIRRHEHLSKA